MRRIGQFLSLVAITIMVVIGIQLIQPVWLHAQSSPNRLHLTYPPLQHQTTSDKIFFIGTAPTQGNVTINGQIISRTDKGHFAPSLPLQMGANQFNLKYDDQTINVAITRTPSEPAPPTQLGFLADSLTPAVNIARQPNEKICLSAIATPNAKVTVRLGNRDLLLLPKQKEVQLPPNSAVLTGQNQPYPVSGAGRYEGCTEFSTSGQLGKPEYTVSLNNQVIKQTAPGNVEILAANPVEIAEVTVDAGVARTGPSTDFSRLTPLPKGTTDTITAKEGDWLRLSYGGWIPVKSVRITPSNTPPRSLVRSISTRQVNGWTEVIIPLQLPVPFRIEQIDRNFKLTLYNVTAQTDTIRVDDDPVITRLDWQQVEPLQIEYQFTLKSARQWGYKVRYEGTSLILSLRHPPVINSSSLQGVKILLDPGHGSSEDYGSRGPTGYPEKDVTLIVSKLLRSRLQQYGANVIMTREGDDDIYPEERATKINKTEPAIALSIHYNALPDSGDAINTAGIGTFWYHSQSHDLAMFLHNYLVEKLKRPSYGVYWNNLALARPTVAPAVLLELGFMINPTEFEWIIDPKQQELLASTLAEGILAWLRA